MEDVLKKAPLFVCLLVLCDLSLLGQNARLPRIVHSTTEKSAIHTPPQEAPAGLKKIFSNLSSSKFDVYYDRSGWGIAGPGSGDTEFVSIPFTPKSDSHVSQVRAAVEYSGRGANQVNLSIYSGSSGTPGFLLAGPVTVTNLPDEATCCALAVANFSPLEVTGGTQYWLVADTPLSGQGSDFIGAWEFVSKYVPMALSIGSGWDPFDANDLPAAEVLGTIP